MAKATISIVFLACLLALAGDRIRVSEQVAPVAAPQDATLSLMAAAPPVPPPALVPDEAFDPDEARARAFLQIRHTGLSAFEEEEVARVIVEEARRHGLEIDMVLAVIHVESAGYHMAVSAVGALGLMQLLPATAEEQAHKLDLDWRGPDSLFDPILNVKLGTAYLETLYARFGNVSTALAAYNWGPNAVERRIRKGKGVPKIYVEKVMAAYDTSPQRS